MVAKAISEDLKCYIDKITDKKNRDGILGYLSAGKDATFKNLTKIKQNKDPKNYDLTIIGTPMWSWNLTPPIRTYLSQNHFKKVAFFCTKGGAPADKIFKEMEKLSKKPIAMLELKTKEVKEEFKEKLSKFIKKLN